MAAIQTRLVLVLGVLLIAVAGAGAMFVTRDASVIASDSSPFPVGHVFTDTEWASVEATLVGRGFEAGTARVVSGQRLQRSDEPFALVRATSTNRGVCFLPVRGTRPGAATCSTNGRLNTPLLAFGAADGSAKQPMTAIVGVARHGISGVSAADARGFVSGLPMVPTTGGLWAVTGGYGSTTLVIRARTASGRVVSQITLP